MDGKLQIIAGILAVFFLGVAAAKAMVQRARKREAAAKSIAASQGAQDVELHNPFASGGVEGAQPSAAGEPAAGSEPGRLQDAADGGAEDAANSKADAPAESIYKWV